MSELSRTARMRITRPGGPCFCFYPSPGSFPKKWSILWRMLMKFLRRVTLSQELVTAGFLVVLAAIGGASWYAYTRLSSLSEQVAHLGTQLAWTTAQLQDATTSLSDALTRESQQVGNLSGTLSTLQKLSKTDPELLAKYSKTFFLNENYAPARLAGIPSQYLYDDTRISHVIPEVLPYLEKLLERAKADGVEIFVDSAYRSFNTQEALKERYVVTYGAGTANQFSAEQGYSEHQLGTTVDFITTGLGGQLAGFDRTPAYDWLAQYAYRYGFVLSYPKNNGYYIYEPWHWRYVGVELATDLHTSHTDFYKLDQRTIDTYLASLFD